MKKQIVVEYRSNNSGGDWWLTDKDWKNLEKAGWRVKWGDGDYEYKNGEHVRDADGFPKFKTNKRRWLGALAKTAWLKCNSVKEAIESFEKVTGQDVTNEGCNCCGAPHNFSWKGDYCSGERCASYLYDASDAKLTKRELLEKLKETT